MGRRILGATSGLLLGLFVAVDLIVFGVIRFESVFLLILPVVGLAVGIGLVAWSPFDRQARASDQLDNASITSDGA